MAATADWVAYYRASREDNGAIEAFCAFDDEGHTISKVHNNEVGVVLGTERRRPIVAAG
jgi:hypothetical protein